VLQALESNGLRSIEIDRLKLIPIEPLLPSAFSNRRDPTHKSSSRDLFQFPEEGNYIEWLSPPKRNPL